MPLAFKLTRHSTLVLYPGLASPIDAVSVLIADRGEGILVDVGSGLEDSLKALASNLALQGYPGRLGVKLVVNTHGHVANAGGDWWAHDVLKATIAARPPDSKWIESGDPVKTGAARFGLVFKGTPVGLTVSGDPYVIQVGELRVEVLHTPGHTPGSQSVYLEDDYRLILIGDSLASVSPAWESSVDDWWRTLEKVKERDPEVICDSVKCYVKEAARGFLEAVEGEGPARVDEA